MKIKITITLIIFGVISSHSHLFANNISPPPSRIEEDLELEELLSMDVEKLVVSVASKRKEKIFYAPGIIDVVTAEEIRRFGARNLRDILGRLTSFQEVSNAFTPNATSTIRGQFVSKEDTHVLFLLNGRPFRQGTSGGNNRSLYMGIPLTAIKQLEIIRGPGSVLYGSNAFAGVVNIVTQSTEEKDRRVSLTYGSFQTKEIEAGGGHSSDEFNVMATAKITDNEGWTWRQAFAGTGPVPIAWDASETAGGLILTANWKNWTFNTFWSFLNQKSNAFTGTSAPVIDDDLLRGFVDIGYRHDFNEDWYITGNLTYNLMEWYISQSLFANDLLGEITLHGAIGDQLKIIAGAIFERHKGEHTFTRYTRSLNSQYLQLSYQPIEWFKLVAGLQRNDAEEFNADYSPRVTAIFKFLKNYGLKLQYSKAFRSPLASQFFVSNNTFVLGNLNTKPEIIKTAEAQLFYSKGDLFFGVTFYQSRYEDILSFIPNPSPASIFLWGNSGHIDFYGVEIEGRGHIFKDWFIRGSLTYQENENQSGVKDITFTPNLMIKFGISYEPKGKGWLASVFNSYYARPSNQTRDIFPGIQNFNPLVTSYHQLDAKVSFHLPTFLQKPNLPDMTFALHGGNLLDEDIFFPDFNGQATNSVPQQSGIRVYGTLSIRF